MTVNALAKLHARIEPCGIGTYVLWAHRQDRTWQQIADDLHVSTPRIWLWATCAHLRGVLDLPAAPSAGGRG